MQPTTLDPNNDPMARASMNAPGPISVAGLSDAQSPINIPNQPLPSNPQAINASIPTPESIIQAAAPTTAADTAQTGILSKIASLMKDKTSLATNAQQQETAAGVPALNATVKSITAQLQGYLDQSTKLQNDATYQIPNQVIDSANSSGRITSTGGLAADQETLQRQNLLKQGQIASQSLTAKSALYAAQNDYSNAKAAADAAAQVAFDGTEQQIAYQRSLLDALKPTLDKEATTQHDLQVFKLDQLQQQISDKRDDFKAGQGYAISAMKLNPNDPAAQYAAQQALKLDPNDPQYLQKTMDLVGKYQQDPVATQQALDDHLYKQAQIKKINADIQATNPGAPIITNPQAGQYKAALDVILGSSKFTKDQKASVVAAVNSGDDPFTVVKNQAKNIMGQTEATKLTSYEAANSAMDDIERTLKDYYAAGGTTDLIKGNMEQVQNRLGSVNDPKLVEVATQVALSLQAYRNAISGTAYSDQEGKDIASVFPGANKSEGLNTAIIAGRKKASDSIIDGIYRSALGSTYDDLKKANAPQASNTNDPYAQFRTQLQPGEILVLRNGQPYAIKQSEFNLKTDTLPTGAMNKL